MPGNIEFYGASPTLAGIVLGGWIDMAWADPAEQPNAVLTTSDDVVTAQAVMCVYPREDVMHLGRGFVLYLPSTQAVSGVIDNLVLASGDRALRLSAAQPSHYDEDQLIGHVRHFLATALPGKALVEFQRMLERPRFTGVNTLPEMAFPVHLEVDRAYACPPRGLLLRGWFLDPFARVTRITLRSGTATQVIDPRRWIAIRRRDVADAYRDSYGELPERCGFLVFVAEGYQAGQPLYFEVETVDGPVGYRPLSPPLQTGLAAIRETLAHFSLRRDELVRGYDDVVGPAIETINALRLRTKPDVDVFRFGEQRGSPLCSLVIPLHGRIDFLEIQLALFTDLMASAHEIIYVLDDPDRRQDTETLAASAFARFQRPFTLLVLSHGVGFAPASNIGMTRASGRYVCFLNSDVFPATTGWLESMIDTLQATPKAGVVGAALFYEDGTLQHDGCTLERLPDFGGWPFPLHPNKGRLVPQTGARKTVDAVTGACMLMRRDLALTLGGFDEGYVIGDFEDADLCLRARDLGYASVVDTGARLYHLERQSQDSGSNPWRFNLTLYNAWRFQARWGERIVVHG